MEIKEPTRTSGFFVSVKNNFLIFYHTMMVVSKKFNN